MFSNSKRLIAAAALLLTLPVMANAQTSRVEGMALQGDYIKDYTAIYGWPSQLPNVGNLVYAEVGNNLTNPNTGYPSTSDRAVGAVLGNLWEGRFGTWAIHLREEATALGQGDNFSQPNPGFGGGDPNENTSESFDLMWGKKFGTTNFGLRMNRSVFKNQNNAPGVVTNLEFDPFSGGGDENFSRNVMGYGAGIGFEMNPQTMVELSFLYQSRTFENSTNTGTPATSSKYADDGPTTYMMAARAMWQWTSNCFIMPVFKWYSFDLSTANTPPGGPTTAANNKLHGWQIGAAGNWQLGTNDLFVLGLTFAQNKLEQEADIFGVAGGLGWNPDLTATETLSPQVFAALETHVNSWLTLRFGANKGAFQKLKAEGTVGAAPGTAVSNETTLSSFNMNIGAGVKVGTLQFDAILANNFYQNLGWLGSGTPGAYFPKVTATYSF